VARRNIVVSKKEFIERFKLSTAGLALYGLATEVNGNLIAKTTLALTIPDTVEKVLSQMYEFIEKSLTVHEVATVKPPATKPPQPATGK
jgi:hypothetical protein